MNIFSSNVIGHLLLWIVTLFVPVAQAQDANPNNPNNLPTCFALPDLDFKQMIEQSKKWHECWGQLPRRLERTSSGSYEFVTFVGEWRNGAPNGFGKLNYENGDKYIGDFKDDKKSGQGTLTQKNGSKYVGEFKNNEKNGQGTEVYAKGGKYIGEFKGDKRNGQGIYILADGSIKEGIWENGIFARDAKVNLPIINNSNIGVTAESNNAERDRPQSADERRRLEEDRRGRELARNTQRINLQVLNTQPNADGDFIINVQTNADTASLKINGEEIGGRADGNYAIKKVARAGQETKFMIVAKDINGNVATKTISVTRQVTAAGQARYTELNPALLKAQSTKDAVAIIIGIADYRSLPKADYANEDARTFYDYAIRGLGVKAENIKLLVDADADQTEIYRAFKLWLPTRVKPTTDVYVFYSGHGLPTSDGQGLYLLPQRADRDFIDKTAINQLEINEAIQSAKPKSVTIFLDSCYSGMTRTGQSLIASARPVLLKSNTQIFPAEFNVITASNADQISSSSPDLRHGIFSYYLMRGMEGEADANKDGKITLGEMHGYLIEQVTRQASLSNRVQQPQLSGDANRVLIGR